MDEQAKSIPLVLQPQELADWISPRLGHDQLQALFVQTEVRVDFEVQAITDSDVDLIPEAPLILGVPQP